MTTIDSKIGRFEEMLLRLLKIAMLLAAPALAQDATVLLQRGIYREETAGDLDGAIQVYRQVLAAGPQAKAYQAQAQERLKACLLRKAGKPTEAPRSRTFIMSTRVRDTRSRFRPYGA